jgi:hypothetical protein
MDGAVDDKEEKRDFEADINFKPNWTFEITKSSRTLTNCFHAHMKFVFIVSQRDSDRILNYVRVNKNDSWSARINEWATNSLKSTCPKSINSQKKTATTDAIAAFHVYVYFFYLFVYL